MQDINDAYDRRAAYEHDARLMAAHHNVVAATKDGLNRAEAIRREARSLEHETGAPWQQWERELYADNCGIE